MKVARREVGCRVCQSTSRDIVVVSAIVSSMTSSTVLLVLLMLVSLILMALILEVLCDIHGHCVMAAIIPIHHDVRILRGMVLVEHPERVVKGRLRPR